MTKYRIRLGNGRVIGPFEKNQLFELKAKGHITGKEEAQIFPTGNWESIQQFDFYAEMMDENRTIVQTSEVKEETFVINLAQLRNQRQEKEIDEMGEAPAEPVEALTETIRMSATEQKVSLDALADVVVNKPEEKPVEVEKQDQGFELDIELDHGNNKEQEDKTLINPVAQQELERMRKKQKEEEERLKAEEEARKKAEEEAAQKALVLAAEKEKPVDESTQMIRLDVAKNELMLIAEEEEIKIKKEYKKIQKKKKKEEEVEEEEETEEDEAKQKKKKLIFIVVAAIIAFAVFFPADDKPKKPPFSHLPPQIVFPIPFDKADTKKSQAEFNKGIEYFGQGTYPSLVKSGLNFKTAYENDLANEKALSFMVRVYAEELVHSKNIPYDAQTLFNIIQSKRSSLMQDPNGVMGLNLFYMTINKPQAAVDVVQKYLKLQPKNVTQELFATYIKSLIKVGKIDVAKQFVDALEKAPNKNHYAYEALVAYMTLNQENDKAFEYISDGLTRNPKYVPFYLKKAELLFKLKRYKEVLPLLEYAENKLLDYNDKNRAKFFELTGLLLAVQGDVKKATMFLTKSLQIEDTDELRMKLADLSTTGGKEAETDKLISESKAIKLLLQAKDFYSKRNYELALSAAAKATDAYPGHIPSELFLAKVQLRLGLAEQGLKTLEALVSKYPEDKEINMAYLKGLIDTYKFHEAKNRIAIVSATPIRDGWEYASINAKLFLQMNDYLQAMSWLKTSISMNPLNDEDIATLASILIKRGNYDPGRTLLNKAIELDPVNPDYRIAYANMIYEKQDDQAAIGYLLSLEDEFGENPKVMAEIATFYYRAGKIKDFQDYKKKIEKLPYRDEALYKFLIKAALMDERYDEIPGLVEKLIAIEPGELEEMMTAGRVLFEEGKLVDAAKWFKRVQEKLPSYPKVQYYIARIKFLSRDYDGALEEIKKDIKENGENDASLAFMATIYIEKEDLVEAENLFKKAQKMNPRSYEAMMGIADISTKRGNYEIALDLYKRALRQKADEAVIHRKIGDVYRQLSQGALAIESYKMYLEMEPEASDRKQIENYIQIMQ